VLWLIVGAGVRLVSIGAAIGAVAAVFASRAVESQLFGVTSLDPTTYVVVAIVLASVAIGASALPARRAMRVDPVAALRSQ
jgi:ABC-type antimicrobial peptide transport system permease subunit